MPKVDVVALVADLPKGIVAHPSFLVFLDEYPVFVDITAEKPHALGVLQIHHILMLNSRVLQLEMWFHPEDELRLGLVDGGMPHWLLNFVDGVDVLILLRQEYVLVDVVQIAVRA